MGTLTNSAKLIEKIQNMRSVVTGNTAPSNPSAGDLWYDTTSTVKALKMYDGTSWVIVGPELVSLTQAEYDALPAAEKSNGKFYLITDASGSISIAWSQITGAPISSGSSAPSNPNEGDIWYDTTNDVLKAYNGSAWVAVGADMSNYLAKNNTTAFTPTGNYNPATKKYVDDAIEDYELERGFISGDIENQADLIDLLKDNYLDIGSTQPVRGQKQFHVEPVLINGKSTAATNTPTLFATEAQVYSKADSSTVLAKNNTATFTPTGDYNPATKKYVDDSISTAVASAYKYKGSVSTYSALPASDNTTGDVWNVTDTDMNYAWTGTAWDQLGSTVDLSNYLAKNNTTAFTPTGDYNPSTKKYVDDGLSGKANASDIKNKVFLLPRQNDNISDIITLLNNGGSVTFYEPYSELATVVGYRYYTVVDYEQQSNVIKAEGEAATVSITLTYGTTTVASVTTEGGKAKKFSLSSTSDMSTAEKIVEWYNLGGVPVILYNSHLYTFQLYEYSSQTGKSYYTFYADVNSSDGASTSSLNNRKIMIEYNPNRAFPYSISDLNSPFATVLKTGVDYATPYTPEYDGSPATKKYVDDNAGATYNAGEGIEIKNGPDYSAMQGPAPSGFHIPLNTEWQAVYDVWTALGGGSDDGTNFGIALKLPCAGSRRSYNSSVYGQGSQGFYWSSSPYPSDADYSYHLAFFSTNIRPQYNSYRALGYSVRCFKDTPIIPTSSWTKLYGTSIEAGGIFWSSTDGLISLSSDGTTWITIQDKNLGATTVWNSGDTVSEANGGKYYQWGNNYGFAWTGSLTTSGTQVDASVYGPGNYYSSSTFITGNNDRSSVQNDNLWGGVTGVVTLDNAITNTGVLSVNGQTGNVTVASPDMSNYLAKDNTTAFTPIGDYNPATKKYVDDQLGNIETLLAAI